MVYPYDLHSTSRGKLPSLTQLISSSQGECSPEFSPDGKKVAFVSERSGISQIWICDSDGRNALQLSSFGGPHGAGSPSWSPDGSVMAVDCVDAGLEDIVMIIDEGTS